MRSRIKLGVALGGGGARGLAHIGFLSVLEKNHIPIDLIVGTSIGALVGAAYATNPDAGALKQRVLDVLRSESDSTKGLKLLDRMQWVDRLKDDWFNRIYRFAQKEVFLSLAMFRNALLSVQDMRDTVEVFVADVRIEQTKVPFAALAVDLCTGEQVILNQGQLITAVMASCAVPGFMPPIQWNDRLLVDGGVANPVPADLAKNYGADVVIAVDVGLKIKQSASIKDGIDVITRATDIMTYHLSIRGRESADLIIEPAVKQVNWANFKNYESIIQQGEQAGELEIENIKNLITHPMRRKLIAWTGKYTKNRRKTISYPTPVN
jgi:NTE family protein